MTYDAPMHESNSHNGTTVSEPKQSPRAFAVGTGFVFQLVGIAFLASACLGGVAGAFIAEPASTPVTRWIDHLKGDSPLAGLLTLGIVVGFVGGAGLIGVGVGLQGERPSSGRNAMIVSAPLALAYWALAGIVLSVAGEWLPTTLLSVFALVSTISFLLAGHSAALLRKYPPPKDLTDATPEIMEEFQRKREERISQYDS